MTVVVAGGLEAAADERRDPRLVLDDQDPGHPAASRCSTTSPARTGAGSSAGRQGQVDRERRAAAGGVGDDALAAVALRDRIDDGEAEARAADRALAVRAVEAAEDAVARGGRDARRRGRAPTGERPRRPARLPISIGDARGRVLGGVVGELQPRLQQAVLIAVDDARRRAASTLQVWSGMTATSSPTRAVSAAEVDVRHREARRPRRSPAGRCPRRAGSCGRARRCRSRAWLATSAASEGSISSRWPRTIVIGVLSSWRTSSSSWRCTSTEPSSRSSIELTVRDRSEMSSLPCVRQARRQVADGDGVRGRRACARIGESRRPATNQPTMPIATSTAIAAIDVRGRSPPSPARAPRRGRWRARRCPSAASPSTSTGIAM